jgi:hypothetical protein
MTLALVNPGGTAVGLRLTNNGAANSVGGLLTIVVSS